MLTSLRRGATKVGTIHKSSALGSRSIVTFIDSDERSDWEIAEFINYTQTVGQDDYPHYKKEYLSPSQKRGMRANRAEGRKSNHNVRGLVQFIQLKQDMKYS